MAPQWMSTSLTIVRVSELSSIRKAWMPVRSGHVADDRATGSSPARAIFLRSPSGCSTGPLRPTNPGPRGAYPDSTYFYVVAAARLRQNGARLPGLRKLFPWRQQRTAGRRHRFLALDDRGRIALQIMGDRLHPDLHRAGRLGGVEILEREEQRARALDDLLHRRVRRLVHSALVGRQPDHAGDPRAAGGHLGPPQDLVGVAGVGRLPDVVDVEGRFDVAGLDVVAERPVHQVGVDREVLHPENRVAVG